MSSGTSVMETQGSTFLWTEHYGVGRTRGARALEALRDAAFGLGLVVLAAGVAGFVTLERPAGRAAGTLVAHRAL